MGTRYFRKKSMLWKIEGAYGVDATPTGAANAIVARDVEFTPMELEYADRDIAQSYLGHQDQIVVTAKAKIAFAVEMAGSGTAGVAPAWGPLVRSCAMSETSLVAAHAGTATAGAGSTITLGVGASAVDDAYRGMRIRLTAGTGSGQARVVASYDGATKVATVSEAWTTPPDVTSGYSIDAQTVYLPISTSMEAATGYFNLDGKKHVLLGTRSSGSFVWDTSQRLPLLKFDCTALLGTISDAAMPAETRTAWKTPVPVNNANTSWFTLHGYAGTLYSASIDLANKIAYRNLVGVEDVQITDRAPAGNIEIEDPTIADKDYLTSVKSATLGAFNLLHGTAAGNQVFAHAPDVQLLSPKYGNRDGVVSLAMGMRLKPNLGNDEFVLGAL